ncbi:unnamed protein product [Adineta steineri]|uniref:Uncharacterized protein n=1 Tax=Adineta steineri TaxID=433720 RepID=A0A813X1N0_9BILA|nr:unnamed protein product [Adineta steineri]CAF3689222.1 unnamed protein product [Adineta steineri]
MQHLLAQGPCIGNRTKRTNDNQASFTNHIYALQSTINDHRKMVFYLMNNTIKMTEFEQYYAEQHKIERKQMFIENLNEIHSFCTQELVPSRRNTLKSNTPSFKSIREVKNLPESLDWHDKGVITEVYHDEVGGIVTAVVGTELVESLHAIEAGKLTKGDPTAPGRCQPDICKPFASFDTIKRMATPDENQMLEWIQESTL